MIALLDQAARLLFLMAAAHALCDRPLQTDLMRAEKSRRQPGHRWIFGLAVHGLIHGGAVALITGMWWIGAAEAVAHAIIDDAKCMGCIGLATDQALHLGCKAAWVAIAIGVSA